MGELLKIEEGLVEGEVLYHKYIQKTEEEKKVIKLRQAQRQNSKEKLRKIQEANIKKKEEAKQKLKEKSLEGMRRKQALAPFSQNDEDGENDKEDDDAEWYRKEVGQEPEKGNQLSFLLYLKFIVIVPEFEDLLKQKQKSG